MPLTDLTAETISPAFTSHQQYIDVDATYAYVGGEDNVIYKLLISDMSLVATSASMGSSIQGMAMDDAVVYCGAWTTQDVHKLDKRVLWRRSDHDITISNTGTARCNPIIGLIADGDNFWPQIIENETTDQTFQWEGTQEDSEELEIDSELGYCVLEGVSAMSGVSGKFVQFAAGSNTIHLENVVGEVVFDWQPRYA